MTLTTILKLNNDPIGAVVGENCVPIIVKVDSAPGGLFGLGTRIVQVRGVRIPPQLELTISGDRNVEQVYFLLRRYCTAFPADVVISLIEPIRAKVVQTQDLSLLTENDLEIVRALNNLYNTDIDGFDSTLVVSSI